MSEHPGSPRGVIEVIGGILVLLFPLFGAFLVAQWLLGNLFSEVVDHRRLAGPGPVRCGGSHVGADVPLCDAVVAPSRDPLRTASRRWTSLDPTSCSPSSS